MAKELDKDRLPPIAQSPGIEGWSKLRIVECGEPLLKLAQPSSEILFAAEYYRRGYKNALKEAFVRKSVLRLLQDAGQLLPAKYKFLVFDAWRPPALQEELFHQYRKAIEFKYPSYTEAQLINETEQYVSFPAVVPSAPYPHLTGGAVDLTICDANDKPIPMGTGFDQFESESRTRHFEESLEDGKKLTPEERAYLTNRRLLFHTLTTVGFTNYSEEWWHYDYGNQFWGRIKGRDAIYGPVSYEHDFT